MLVLLVLKNAVECTSQRFQMDVWGPSYDLFGVKQASKQASKQADKQTSRQADKQTSRHSDKQTSGQADNGKALKKFIGSAPWPYEVLFWQI